MEKIQIRQSNIEELTSFITMYFEKEEIKIDAYNEYFILISNFYKITLGEKVIGCFAIMEQETLTLFALQARYSKFALELFKQAKQYEKVQSAVVLSNDLLFMNLCMDDFSNLARTGFLTSLPQDMQLVNPNLKLVLAQESDHLKLENLQKNDVLYPNLMELINKQEVYKVEYKSLLVGYATYEASVFNPILVSFGIYTSPDCRGKGFAKNMLKLLNNKAIEENRFGIAGCAYDNVISLRTQFAAGATCKHRSYKFNF